jgi:hypothetical protein
MHEHAAHLHQGDPGPDATVPPLPRKSLRDSLAERHLQWFPELGVGYFPVTECPYDQAYFDRFTRQAAEPIGRRLMTARVAFVEQCYRGLLLDVGIGSGAFIEKRNLLRRYSTFGFDINPAGVAWLKQRELWFDPEWHSLPAVSMWDVLEHMHDFRPLLSKVSEWLFLSLPIFRDAAHVLGSKHYRKDEHCWYWTHEGLVTVLRRLGFKLVATSTMEIDAGREDIGAFAFRRKGN